MVKKNVLSAKKKNGHKLNCGCHICENIANKAKRGGYEEEEKNEEFKKMGGLKKKNGHKPNCACIICKHMKNAKKRGKKSRGGDGDKEETINEIPATDEEYDMLDTIKDDNTNTNNADTNNDDTNNADTNNADTSVVGTRRKKHKSKKMLKKKTIKRR